MFLNSVKCFCKDQYLYWHLFEAVVQLVVGGIYNNGRELVVLGGIQLWGLLGGEGI